MKIGIYCTNNYVYPVPSGQIYASITVAGNLADTLTTLGHDVTFFAPEGTKTRAKLITFEMSAFSESEIYSKYPHVNSSYQYENLMLTQSLNFAESNHFDIFHSHCRPLSITSFAALKPNLSVVATVHDPLVDDAFNILPEFNRFKNLHFVALSKDQQSIRPNLNWAGVVPNGIGLERWSFQENPGDYLLFVGRIMPEKGPEIAIQVAKILNLPLKLYGSIYDHHRDFFAEKIAPFLSSDIQFFETVPQDDLPEIYANAKALLMPTNWHEPFGLTSIEANACGTPVIAFNKGALPEIVDDGKNGFLVSTVEEMTDAIGKVGQIDRRVCRKIVEEKFNLTVMANNYLSVYQSLRR